MTKPKLSRAWALRSLPSLLVSAPGVCGRGCGARFGRAANNVTNINFKTGATVENESSRLSKASWNRPSNSSRLSGWRRGVAGDPSGDCATEGASFDGCRLAGGVESAGATTRLSVFLNFFGGLKKAFFFPAILRKRVGPKSVSKKRKTVRKKFQCFPSPAAAMIITNACALRPRIKRMCFSSLHAFWLLLTSSADYALGHRLHPHLRHHLPFHLAPCRLSYFDTGNIA